MKTHFRVLQLHNRHRAGGGADSVVDRERSLLTDAGHVVHTHLEHSADYIDQPAYRQAAVSVWNRAANRKVRALIDRFEPDVAHLHTPFPFLSPSVIHTCGRQGVPVVMTSHAYRLMCMKGTLERNGEPCFDCIGRPMRAPAVAHCCYRSSRLMTAALAGGSFIHSLKGSFSRDVSVHLALTPYMRERLIEDGIPAERVFVHGNFVPKPQRPNVGEREGYVFVGRLAPEKGAASLIEGWRLLGPDAPSLTVVGSGPMLEALSSAAPAMVRFTGELSNSAVLQTVAAAKALIFPSIWPEGQGLSWIEAVATGTPVVYSDAGNFSDVLDDLGCGISFRSGSAAGLAEAVRAVESLDRNRWMELSGRARVGFEERFTARSALQRLTTAYAMACRTNRSS